MASIFLMVICWQFFLRDQEQDKGATMTISIQHCTRGPSQYNKARVRINSISMGKKENKTSSFIDYTIVYEENPPNGEIISTFQ